MILKDKFYDVCFMNYADYDFNFCEQKENLSKMLENLTPTEVEEVDLSKTGWDLWGKYNDNFNLSINGTVMETSTCANNLIEDLLFFLPQLAYTDDKSLICPFEYEGYITAFMTTPVDTDKIRVSVLEGSDVWKYNKEAKFGADVIIKKDTFLKQMSELFKKVVKDTVEENDAPNRWVNKINYTLSVLEKYFENPDKFKKEYEPKRHIRVFDAAYKDLDNTWKFKTLLEGDIEANVIYWAKDKNMGKILDYDFFEQYSDDLFIWNKDFTGLIKQEKEDIRKNLKPDMDNRLDRNWIYSKDTEKWYSSNEVMPYFKDEVIDVIHNRFSCEVEVVKDSSSCADEKLKWFIESSYDVDGELDEENLGYLSCRLNLISEEETFAKIEFDYSNYKQIRQGLEKVKNGEYARFDLGEYKYSKMHIWQELYYNSKTIESRDVIVACYDDEYSLIYSFTADKNKFVSCFNNALDEIEQKVKVTKHLLEVGKTLNIEEKFKLGSGYGEDIEYIGNFIGDYACVCKECSDGAGIINKNLEWVIKPEHATITGKEHPEWGVEIRGIVRKYRWIENVDGKLFIATKDDYKKFVMDINGNIKIPHVSDEIYYTYLNDELWFIAVDYNKTYIVNSKGEDVLTFDFPIGEKFWLFDEIIIISKDDKYGIIDWKGKVKIDFIFSDITPDKNNLDFIPVKYIEQWGYVNKKGKVIDMKIKDIKSEADCKCSQVNNGKNKIM